MYVYTIVNLRLSFEDQPFNHFNGANDNFRF